MSENTNKIYSHDIDEQVKEQVESEYKGLDPNADYLDEDPLIHNQEFTVLSFCQPKSKLVQEVETLCFTYFLAEEVGRKVLAEMLLNDELDIEETYQVLVKKYVDYKKNNRVALRNRLIDQYGTEPRVDALVKPRGTYKNMKKAQDAQKKLAKMDGFSTYIARTGKWFLTNPDKFINTEHYDSAEPRMNDIVRGHKEETEKASRAHGLRKDILERQAKKIAEEIKEDNKRRIEAGEFDENDPELPNVIRKDTTKLTEVIEDKKEKLYGKNTVELDLPIPDASDTKTLAKQIEMAGSLPTETS